MVSNITNKREIILDTETTGLSPSSGHKIVEFGALEMIDKVLTGRQLQLYTNPERDMPNEAYRVHGISSEFLKDKPLFKDVAQEIIDFLADSDLVIHNATFDMKFLNYEMSLINRGSLENNITDTLKIARRTFPGARASLDALCKRFNIDNSNREFHGALKDSFLLSEVYIELCGGKQKKFIIETKKASIAEEEKLDLSYRKGVLIHPTKEELEMHEKLLSKIN